MHALTRRRFLQLSASAAAAVASRTRGAEAQTPAFPPLHRGTSFFLVGDTHYFASREQPSELDPVSRVYTSGLIDRLNSLPGTELPPGLGGGLLPTPTGLLHAGDVIDTGDKSGALFDAMQATEFAAYRADFGLNGNDGKLKVPVCEVHGNHDAPHGTGLVLDAIRERNAKRSLVKNVSRDGLHYSWDWGGIHFINLGLLVGRLVGAARGFAPLASLDFLIEDLAGSVGASGRLVIITHHIDVGRNSADAVGPQTVRYEWEPADLRGYYAALRGYRIGAILHGHTHTRRVLGWDGTLPRLEGGVAGVPVFNTDNSAHYKLREQAFFHLQITDTEIVAREYFSPDGWVTAEWSPQFWRVPLPV